MGKTIVRKKVPPQPKTKAKEEWYGLKVNPSGSVEMVLRGGDRAAYAKYKKAYTSPKKKKQLWELKY